MFANPASIAGALKSYRLDGRMMCYNNFVPKLYNWCLDLGFTPGKIMPSRAFCSDENQGFPIILIARHFGAFPFNHGRVGGIVSVDRHGPHAEHGQDLLLLQASHVGYDPDTREFGIYRRLHTADESNSCSCGKIGYLVNGYAREYRYACENIRLTRHDGQPAVLIDNLLTSTARDQGLYLNASNLVLGGGDSLPAPLAPRSTGNVFPAAPALVARLGASAWPDTCSEAIGSRLAADDFYFKRDFGSADPTQNQLERNLVAPMPWIVTSPHPLLTAACANTQAEFDRTYRSLAFDPAMRGKNLLFLSGLNIDISPRKDEHFPLTKFVPWAAFIQGADGTRHILEQDELVEKLGAASSDNRAQIDLEQAIAEMSRKREVVISL